MDAKISRRTAVGSISAAALSLFGARLGFTDDEVKPLRFAVYGDCRDGHDVHRKIVSLIVKDEPSMVFQTGDLVHRGNDDSLWKIFDDITSEMRKKALYYPARGNHDFGDTGYYKRITSPITTGTGDYYTVDKENCHFIILDVDEHTEFGPKSEQGKWLVKDLELN